MLPPSRSACPSVARPWVALNLWGYMAQAARRLQREQRLHQLLLPGVWETERFVLGRPAGPVRRVHRIADYQLRDVDHRQFAAPDIHGLREVVQGLRIVHWQRADLLDNRVVVLIAPARCGPRNGAGSPVGR